jgi:hypothetical protein
MESMRDVALYGRKVFFVYPPNVITELLPVLVQNEYEVYVVREHERFARFLQTEPNAIVYANVSEGQGESAWVEWLRKLKADPAYDDLKLGVMSLGEERALPASDLKPRVGSVVLRPGLRESLKILTKTLDEAGAKGRRRFVRAVCPQGSASFNAKVDGETYQGSIVDLSSAGMACRFDSAPPTWHVGKKFTDLQLLIKGQRVLVSGTLAARRDESDPDGLFVLLFASEAMDDDKRGKLYSAIQRILVSEFERVLSKS